METSGGPAGPIDVEDFDLFGVVDVAINLDVWLVAVDLQRQRIRAIYSWPADEPGQAVSGEVVGRFIAQCSADSLLFVLAIDQLAEGVAAIRHRMPAFATEIDAALTHFDQACPDRKKLRNAVAHIGEYLVGQGRQQGTAPTVVYEAGPSSMFFVVDEGLPSLQVDFDAAASAAADLGKAINEIIAVAFRG